MRHARALAAANLCKPTGRWRDGLTVSRSRAAGRVNCCSACRFRVAGRWEMEKMGWGIFLFDRAHEVGGGGDDFFCVLRARVLCIAHNFLFMF